MIGILRFDKDGIVPPNNAARAFSAKEPYLTFRYAVVPVWQLAPEPLLSGGLALLPLAPISDVTEAELPGIIKRMEQRLSTRRSRRQAPIVWGAAYILLGLRHSPALAAQLFRGVMSMKESSTYQAILEEGRGEGALAEAKKKCCGFRATTPSVFPMPERPPPLKESTIWHKWKIYSGGFVPHPAGKNCSVLCSSGRAKDDGGSRHSGDASGE